MVPTVDLYAGASKLCGPVPKYEFRVEGGIIKMKGRNEGDIMPILG